MESELVTHATPPDSRAEEVENPIIALKPNSLYITTQMLMAPGKFHWALLITDAECVATKHHWSGAHGTIGATETYISSTEHPSRTYTSGNAVIFAYFLVEGYEPPEDSTALIETFRNVFPVTYSTLRESRQKGITCRTWLLKVLDTFQQLGIIVRPDPVAEIEGDIIRRTKQCEMWVAESEEYTSRVFVL